MRSRTVPAILLASTLIAVCSCNRTPQTHAENAAASQNQSPDRKAAPEFTLTDENGASVKLSDYRGKVVLLNFWATWCGPCTIEIPWFEEFEQQYRSRGFEVLGVSMDEDGWKAIKPFAAEHKVNYRILLGNDSVSQLYGGVDSLPTTFIIDREGKFAFAPHIGLAEKNDYLKEIQALLGVQQTRASRLGVSYLPAVLFSRPNR